MSDAANACPNGPDEHGVWPCDPLENGDGTATCGECGWTGPLTLGRPPWIAARRSDGMWLPWWHGLPAVDALAFEFLLVTGIVAGLVLAGLPWVGLILGCAVLPFLDWKAQHGR